MTSAKRYCELSFESDQDIESIFNYTRQQHGTQQAVTYVSGFDNSFAQLIDNPEIGRMREEIRPGLRSLVHGNHVIFYRVLIDRIRIIRVLHSRQDLQRGMHKKT